MNIARYLFAISVISLISCKKEKKAAELDFDSFNIPLHKQFVYAEESFDNLDTLFLTFDSVLNYKGRTFYGHSYHISALDPTVKKRYNDFSVRISNDEFTFNWGCKYGENGDFNDFTIPLPVRGEKNYKDSSFDYFIKNLADRHGYELMNRKEDDGWSIRMNYDNVNGYRNWYITYDIVMSETNFIIEFISSVSKDQPLTGATKYKLIEIK